MRSTTTTCKQCGLDVRWVRDGKRKKCLNPDGSDHWGLCSQTRFARIKLEGTHFEREGTTTRISSREKGYSHAVIGDKLYEIACVSIRGERYKPSCGECAIPPWESCDCSALLGVAA